MFRYGYGKLYGYTYIQPTAFSTYVDNFTSNILRSSSANRQSTHSLHQDRRGDALRCNGNNNDDGVGKSSDTSTKGKQDAKRNRSNSGGGCGGKHLVPAKVAN